MNRTRHPIIRLILIAWFASPAFVPICAHARAELPKSERLAVPYYMQGARNWCGPASLAMALKYAGQDAEIWEIAAAEGKVSEPCRGVLDLLTCYQSGATAAQHHEQFVRARYAAAGLTTESNTYLLVKSQKQFIARIKQHISAGWPVMLMSLARVHWIVVTGYDEKGVWYHDPSGAFNPSCGRGPECLINAYLTWSTFADTIKQSGAAPLQLLAVKRKDWETVPAEHRRSPKPTIQILPDLYRDKAAADGDCGGSCFLHRPDKGRGWALWLPASEPELNRNRRYGIALRGHGTGKKENGKATVHLRVLSFQIDDAQALLLGAGVAARNGKESCARIKGLGPGWLGQSVRPPAGLRHGPPRIPFAAARLASPGQARWAKRILEFSLALDSPDKSCRAATPSNPPEHMLHIILAKTGGGTSDLDIMDRIAIPLAARAD